MMATVVGEKIGTCTNSNDCLMSCYNYFMSSDGEYVSGCQHNHGVNNKCYACYLDSYVAPSGSGSKKATCWL